MTDKWIGDEDRRRFSQSLSLRKGPLYISAEGKTLTRKCATASLLLILVILVCSPRADAKGTPDKIAIRGGKFPRPIEITDRNILKGFDPWNGQFIDWEKGLVANPPDRHQSFEVFFYKKSPGKPSRYDQGNLKLIYVLRYYPGRNGEAGMVYLPGQGEAFHSLNMGTITRPGHDGRWHYATPEWGALIKQQLAADKPPRVS